jgi:hypothetical protein
VQDASLMRVVHGAGHGRHQPRGSPQLAVESLSLNRQVAAIDELHAEVVVTLVLAHLVDRYDARMIEVGRCRGLEPEPHQVIGAGMPAGADHLERQNPVQAHLPGAVDDSHAPWAITWSSS